MRLAKLAAEQHVTVPRLLVESARRGGETPTQRRGGDRRSCSRCGAQLAGIANNVNQLARVANTDGRAPVGTAAALEGVRASRSTGSTRRSTGRRVVMPNITRGGRMLGLMAYLVGPGREGNEVHIEPHLVTGDAAIMAWHDDAVLGRPRRMQIGRELDHPRVAFGTEVTHRGATTAPTARERRCSRATRMCGTAR